MTKTHRATYLLVFVAGVFSFTYANAGIVVQQDAYTHVRTFDNSANSTSAKRRWAQTFHLSASTTIREITIIADSCLPFENTDERLWIFKQTSGSLNNAFLYNETRGDTLEEMPSYSFGANEREQYGSFMGVPAYRWTDELELGPGEYMFTEAGWNSPTPGNCGDVDNWRIVTNEGSPGYPNGRATAVLNWGGADLTWSDGDAPFEDADGMDLAFRISDSVGDPGIGDGIPWGAYYSPSIYNPDAPALIASSSLWDAYEATTTLLELERCIDSGNVFSRALCLSISYLFMPSPEVLNQWSTIPTQTQERFPFSWVASVQTSLETAAASSTGNMPLVSMNLHDLNIGSSSPMGNIMPNFVALSTTTVRTFIPDPVWSAGQLLMQTTLWMALCFDIYATVRRRHAHV